MPQIILTAGAILSSGVGVERRPVWDVRSNEWLAASTQFTTFDVAGEVIEDCLPAALLLLNGVSLFSVKDNPYIDAAMHFVELNPCSPVPKGILQHPVGNDVGIGAREIKAKASVLCLHPGRKDAAHAEINAGFGGVPIIRCCIPLNDIFRRDVRLPYSVNRCADILFDGDLHGSLHKIHGR